MIRFFQRHTGSIILILFGLSLAGLALILTGVWMLLESGVLKI
jgi:hypothetical protein